MIERNCIETIEPLRAEPLQAFDAFGSQVAALSASDVALPKSPYDAHQRMRAWVLAMADRAVEQQKSLWDFVEALNVAANYNVEIVRENLAVLEINSALIPNQLIAHEIAHYALDFDAFFELTLSRRARRSIFDDMLGAIEEFDGPQTFQELAVALQVVMTRGIRALVKWRFRGARKVDLGCLIPATHEWVHDHHFMTGILPPTAEATCSAANSSWASRSHCLSQEGTDVPIRRRTHRRNLHYKICIWRTAAHFRCSARNAPRSDRCKILARRCGSRAHLALEQFTRPLGPSGEREVALALRMERRAWGESAELKAKKSSLVRGRYDQ